MNKPSIRLMAVGRWLGAMLPTLEDPGLILGVFNFFLFPIFSSEFSFFFIWNMIIFNLLFMTNLLKCHGVVGRIVMKLIEHHDF